MAKHGKRIPWRRLRSAYRDLARDYQKLACMYRQLQTEHADHLRSVAGQVPAAGQTTWGWISEMAASDAETVETPLPGLDPDKAGALVRNSGLLHSPGFGQARNGHTPV